MKIEKRKISELIRAEYNPRKITKVQLQELKDGIDEFSLVLPLVVNENPERKNVIIGGHQRLKICEEMGYTEVDCSIVNLPLDKEKKLNIKLNKNGGSFDDELLQEHFEYEELIEWGFTPDELFDQDEKTDGLIDDDEIPEVKESKVKRGDIWQLGEHRIMCGDSTSSDDVEKLMNGEKADMAHNDPPYGMKKENDGVLNDNLNYSDLLNFNKEWIPLQFSYLKDNGSFYCWGIDEPLMDIYSEILKPFIKEQKATFRNLITWSKFSKQKPTCIEGMRSYVNYEEKCLFVMCGVQGFNNNADNYFQGFETIREWLVEEKKKSGMNNTQIKELTNTSHTHYWTKSQWAFPTKEHYNKIKNAAKGVAFNKEYEELKKEYEELKKEFYGTRAYFNNTHETYMTTVWNFTTERNGDEGGHATPKPIPLCERVIKSSCPDNGLVLDMFLGSGSTLIAAEKLNRKCYGMELDEKYCDVIIERWEQFTGQKAEKIND